MSLYLFAKHFAATAGEDKAEGSRPAIFEQTTEGFDLDELASAGRTAHLTLASLCQAAWALTLSRHLGQADVEFWYNSGGPKSGDSANKWNLRQSTINDSYGLAEFADRELKDVGQPCWSETAVWRSVIAVEQPDVVQADSKLPDRCDVSIRVFSPESKVVTVECVSLLDIPSILLRSVVTHFLCVIKQMKGSILSGSIRLGDLSMMDLEEEWRIRKQESQSKSLADYAYGSIHQCFRAQARRTPHAAALQGAGNLAISYAELDAMTDRMAGELRELTGIGDTDTLSPAIVGILLRRSPSIVVSVFACWKAGMAVVILDVDHPSSRNDFIIRDSGCQLVVVDQPTVGLDAATVYDFESLRARSRSSNPKKKTTCTPKEIDSLQYFHELACIRYTSGSTGQPKGILQNHAALATALGASGPLPGTKVLPLVNMTFTAAWSPILTYLLRGGCVCVFPITADDGFELPRALTQYHIDDVYMTRGALSLLSPEDAPNLKHITLVAEPVPQSVVALWRDHVTLTMDYGSTEMNTHSYPLYEECDDNISAPAMALPIDDCAVYILQPNSTTLAPLFVPGEICVSSTYMSGGYIGDPERTAKAFIHHPFPGDCGHTLLYRTGDMGMMLGRRRFVVLGRSDYQLKVDGHRVQPEEVEHVIHRHPRILQAKVVQVTPLRSAKALLVACIRLREESDRSASDAVSEMRAWCRELLPKYMIPNRWLPWQNFPQTATGKIDSTKLASQVAEHLDEEATVTGPSIVTPQSRTPSLAPGGEDFLRLALITLVGKDHKHVSAPHRAALQSRSFLASGGSSLAASSLLTQLRRLNIELPLELLYSEQSLEQVATQVTRVTDDDKTASTSATDSPWTNYLGHLPMDFERSQIESIFPTSMMQAEFIMTSILNPMQGNLYQYYDLSKAGYTIAQIREAFQQLALAKPILRTLFSPLDIPHLPRDPCEALQTLGLTAEQSLVQMIMHKDVLDAEVPVDSESVAPREHFRKDYPKGWSFRKPWWRATYLSRPKILSLVLHHSLTDEWSFNTFSKDLFAVLKSLQNRDDALPGSDSDLIRAFSQAQRPSPQAWAEKVYKDKGLDLSGSSQASPILLKHSDVWADFMRNVVPTRIPEVGLLSPTAEPPYARGQLVSDLPYGRVCEQLNVTAASLFQVAFALVMARTMEWRSQDWASDSRDMTFYRVSSNRRSTDHAAEVEGALFSTVPARLTIRKEDSIGRVAHGAMTNWLKTCDSDLFFAETTLESTGPTMFDKKRRWGNVIFNHIAEHDDGIPDLRPPDLIQDTGFYTPVWQFCALETIFVETEANRGDRVHVFMLSGLPDSFNDQWIQLCVRALRIVVDGGSNLIFGDALEQLVT